MTSESMGNPPVYLESVARLPGFDDVLSTRAPDDILVFDGGSLLRNWPEKVARLRDLLRYLG